MSKQRGLDDPRWNASQDSLADYEREPRERERPVVELRFEELKRINEWAEGRNEMNTTNSDCGIDGKTSNVRGLKGEYALAKQYNIPWESQPCSVIDGPDDGYEFELTRFDEQRKPTVDVKATKYAPAWLKARTDRKLKADVYVLAHCDGARIELVGWITRKQLRAREPTQSVAGCTLQQENYVAQPDELRRMPEQWEVQR
jgi:hypothetical protein